MKRLLLINPVGRRSGLVLSRVSRFQPLGLAYVAAVTPDDWDVSIYDENFDRGEMPEADLVGITAFTSTIGRAYEIAGRYRSRGTKVVLGGIHASMLPDEALRYADAVVVGEVEDIWAKVLGDFGANRMSGIYQGPRVDLGKGGVIPRRELYHPGYVWQSIQTSRGCPFNCSFCSVSRYLGSEYRQRPVESVLRELEGIKSRNVLFMDDNLVGYSQESRKRAVAIFDGMLERGIRKDWWMQASVNIAEDGTILDRAAAAGCMLVFIGFETTDEHSLKDMHKGVNLRTGPGNYAEVITKLHARGMAVHGGFIIGNDHESPEDYRQLADFLIRAGVDVIQVTILTPLPGTDLMARVEAEGRLEHHDFPADWSKFRFSYLTHRVEGTSPETVYTGNNLIKRRIYSFPRYQARMLRSLFTLRNPAASWLVLRMNRALKLGWRNSHYRNLFPTDFAVGEGKPPAGA